MPRDSRRVRQLRRLKRERALLTRMLDHTLQERNMYRAVLEKARNQALADIVAESKKNEAAMNAVTVETPD